VVPGAGELMSAVAASPAAREQSRARYPHETGLVERDGVRVFWERYGSGSPTILLMPTWSILHSRHWKFQIADLARSYQVVTFDGRGNGRSDRPQNTAAYADTEFVEDAVAALDAVGVNQAIIAGFSMGAGYALRMAADHPDRVLGAVFIGSSVRMSDRPPGRVEYPWDQPIDTEEGWAKYNRYYWLRDWPAFCEFFMSEIFSERHSTKQIEDTVGWALETDPETIVTAEDSPYLEPPPGWPPDQRGSLSYVQRVRCPSLVIHGDDDHISHVSGARRLAEGLRAPLVVIRGGGHAPLAREPVKVNLLMREFIERTGGRS
jgi:pimeloyl-ACP methyl ester carboxylesterase